MNDFGLTMIHNSRIFDKETETLQVIGNLLGVSPNHTLALKLAARRIKVDVITMFDIRARGEGWTYPTPRGALRFKNGDSDAPHKYAWIGHKRDTLLYGPDLHEAVKQAGGNIWLVTEFDFFAMQSAGIPHVIAQTQGEGSVPNDLPEFLRSLGIIRCHIAPDRDDQGTSWSQRVADKLIPAGIDVYSYEIPYPRKMSHGADLGKLWQEYSRSRSFEQYLLSLSCDKLSARPDIKDNKTRVNLIIPDDHKALIAHMLEVKSYKDNGYSKNIRCPFHEDSKPSAALHCEFGLHCFKCGWKGWTDLAEKLGIPRPITLLPTDAPQITLGDELLQTMVKAGLSVLAHVLETMYRTGWKPGQIFTIENLIALGIPRKRARKAFAQMEGREADGRVQRKASSHPGTQMPNKAFCPQLALFFFISKEVSELGKKVGHRPAKVKILPNPTELAQGFGVTITRRTQIPLKQNMADWRAEIYALPINYSPGTYPRKKLCKPLGISGTTSRTYDKRAGIIVTPNIQRTELKNADQLPDTPDQIAVWLETEEVVTDKTGREKFRRFAATKSGYSRALQSVRQCGGSIWLVKQLANSYRRSVDPQTTSGDTEKV